MHPFFKIKTAIRVAFEDVDAFNVVHNAKYFVFFERGRVEYLRHLGFVNDGPASMKNFEVAIVEHRCVYRRPALFDDLLDVHLRISHMKKSSFQFQYVVERSGTGDLLTLAYTNLVYFDSRTMKPCPIKPEVREAVERFEGDHLGKMTGLPEL